MLQIEFGFAAILKTPLTVVGPQAQLGEVRSAEIQEAFGRATAYQRHEIAAVGEFQSRFAQHPCFSRLLRVVVLCHKAQRFRIG